MKLSHARRLPADEVSDDFAEAVAAEKDGRCALSDGAGRGTIGVFWFAAPSSDAAGGPLCQLTVRGEG